MGENTETKLYGLLIEMVKDHSSLFDKETARYILNRLPCDILNSPKNVYSGINNFSLQTNLLGFVYLKNIYGIQNNDFSKIDDWIEILKEKDESLIKSPDFIFTPNQETHQTPNLKYDCRVSLVSNFATYYAVLNYDLWYKIKNNSFFDVDMNNLNDAIICLDLLCPTQNTAFYFYNDNEKKDASKILFNSVLNGKKEILEKKWHNEKTFTSKIMGSFNFKAILGTLDCEVLESLFSTDSLGIILKQSHDYETLKRNSNMLNNLLGLAPAEKWINAWKNTNKNKSKTLNIVDLFNNKFHKAYSLNIIEGLSGPGIRKEKTQTSILAAASFKDEFDFFLPEIKKHQTNPGNMINLFNSIMRSDDVDLFNLYFKYMDDIPAYEEGFDNQYKIMNDRFNKSKFIQVSDTKNVNSWKELFIDINKNKLENLLSDNQPKKRTVKI